ncbi:heat shock protein Hsp33 [Enterococcus faecium]|nr:heat shock protein Hsp33 [Enterococcus faecium]
MKGYIKNPHLSLPLNSEGKIDVRGAVGTQGMFTVTKDLGLKNLFLGKRRLFLEKSLKILLTILLSQNKSLQLLD